MIRKILIEDGGILYLTDCLPLLRQLLARGEKAAAILTKENRGEDFTGLAYAVERVDELEPADFIRLYRRLAGLPWDILETERCRLRELTEGDFDRLYEIYAEPSITRYMEGLFGDREEERRYMADYRRYVYEFYGYGIWGVEERQSGLLIGRAGLEPRDGEVELGFVIARPWQRMGYGYEVCQAVLTYADREIECDRILSRVRPANTASKSLLHKLGFYRIKESDGEGMETYEYRKKRGTGHTKLTCS